MSADRLPFRRFDAGANSRRYRKGDCVTRAIATVMPDLGYDAVADALQAIDDADADKRYQKVRARQIAHAARGGFAPFLPSKSAFKAYDVTGGNGVQRDTYHRYLISLGWTWKPLIKMGQRWRMRFSDLPKTGTMLVKMHRHLTVVHNGQIIDTWDCGAKNPIVHGIFYMSKAAS